MNRRPRIETVLAILVSLARTFFCGYRAVHQSLIIDEAISYHRYIAGPWRNIHSAYDASNHVLYSILGKASVHALGLSEFTLRLPSLISGFFLALGIFHLLRRTTPPAIRWVAFLALALHPLLLDFSVAARGYGLSLALFVWALDFVIGRRYALGGVLLGLALSANLTIAFPAAGLCLAILLLDEGPWAGRFRSLAKLAAPAAALFLAICSAALRTAERANFYVGLPTIRGSLYDLVESSFHITPRSGVPGSWLVPILLYALPLISGFIVLASLLGSGNRRDLFPLTTLAGAAAALVFAHYVEKINYPIDRTGLYILVLFGIAWAIATARLRPKALRAAPVALGAFVAILFATQLQVACFPIWQFDMRMKEIARIMQRMSAGKPANSLSVSCSWLHSESLEFYRVFLHINALEPVLRVEPTQFSGHDFYVLSGDDAKDLEAKPIRIVFSDPTTPLVFGVPAGP